MKNLDIKNLKAAKRYSRALLEAGENNLDEIKTDLESVDEIIFKNESLCAFFVHPVISLKDKKEILKEAFEGKINTFSYNFIETLINENRFDIFETIFEVFKKDLDEYKNNCRIEVISALELDENQKNALEEKLNNKLNKKTIVNYNTNEEIIGGIVIKFEDKVIDLSLKTKFESLKKQII